MLRNTKSKNHNRKLRFEQCEDRRMLAGIQADIVFIADESNEASAFSHDWLEVVIGRLEDPSYDNSLASNGIDDIRYGLVGFGDDSLFAHSHIVNSNGATYEETLFGTSSQMIGVDQAIRAS